MAAETLPACGLYRTLAPVSGVPAGRLVFFHNHGEPGPGIYLPTGWVANRAQFESGRTLDDPSHAALLEPLPEQGLYRVVSEFHCCEKLCRHFEAELLVQLGYDGAARPLLFVPEWVEGTLAFPERGFPLDAGRIGRLSRLQSPVVRRAPAEQLH